MNRKVIKAILTKKFNDWVKTIEDDHVKSLVKKNTIITGGSIASLLLNEEVKDFDVYFKNKETVKAVADYYVNRFNEKHPNTEAVVLDGDDKTHKDIGFVGANLISGRIKIAIQSKGVAAEDPDILNEPFEDVYDVISDADQIPADQLEKVEEKEKYRPVFLSSNAITLSDRIQIVVRFYGEAAEIHENYDFAHCTNYWTSEGNKLELRPEALECLLAKQLKYVGSKYPLCSVIRTRKFIKRGFHINAGQYLKMLFQLSQLDLTDINVLEDQLVGVDSTYFNMLIDSLRKKQESDPSFEINDGYITSIIDKIF